MVLPGSPTIKCKWLEGHHQIRIYCRILGCNAVPQSVRFCGVMDMEFVKESKEILIERFKVILTSLNHNFAIDPDKVGAYCYETAEMYVDKYGWYYMSLHYFLRCHLAKNKNYQVPLWNSCCVRQFHHRPVTMTSKLDTPGTVH
ncbi:unnamed protein product [Orchesella dallaii]|uniref:Uncharacterized protein n=1 Tax=Orchesella dallaii TaxID=48710 RepID=A0ABP1PTS9_9HEXA